MIQLEGTQRRLTIFIGESDHYGRTPLATEIVQRAQAAGLAGATVLRGIEGFGVSNHVHTTRILSLSADLPMVVLIVDDPVRIDAFTAEIRELITEGLMIIDDVQVVHHVGRDHGPDT